MRTSLFCINWIRAANVKCVALLRMWEKKTINHTTFRCHLKKCTQTHAQHSEVAKKTVKCAIIVWFICFASSKRANTFQVKHQHWHSANETDRIVLNWSTNVKILLYDWNSAKEETKFIDVIWTTNLKHTKKTNVCILSLSHIFYNMKHTLRRNNWGNNR